MTSAFADDLVARLQGLKPDGLYREEQVIASPQQGEVRLEGGAACINLCANNYLARKSHQLPAADADPCAVTGRTPSNRFDVVSATPSASFGPCGLSQRRLAALATKAGEISGLGACAAERFRMDGCIADLPAICDLAERYDAMVTFDDSHAVGFVGASVRGTHVPRRAGRAAPWYRPDLCTPLAHAEELQVLRTKNARQ